jgi:hypothetical protein
MSPDQVTVVRTNPKAPLYLADAVSVGFSSTVPIELYSHRPPGGGPTTTSLVDRSSGGPVERPLGGVNLDFARGLRNFARIEIDDARGHQVLRRLVPVCPLIGPGPISPSSGPHVVTPVPAQFRELLLECAPLADQLDWGVLDSKRVIGVSTALKLKDGAYTARVIVNPRGAFPDSNRKNNVVTASFPVQTTSKESYETLLSDQEGGLHFVHEPENARPPAAASSAPGALPDLAPTQPSNLELVHRSRGGQTLLRFDSTVGNYGDAPLALVGTRRGTAAAQGMAGVQLLRDSSGQPVRRPVNDFYWDTADGHHHWHYNNLARYELLDSAGNVIRSSPKIGFCFVATTQLRLPPQPGPRPNPLTAGGSLRESCGQKRSKIAYMALEAGWGDTYGGQLKGQYLDLSGLPAGTYRLKITVNADGSLVERTHSNNTIERPVTISGSGRSMSFQAPALGLAAEEHGQLQRHPRPRR